MEEALYRYVLRPGRSFQLLAAVACGVGLASACGLLRLQFRLGLKVFIFCSVVPWAESALQDPLQHGYVPRQGWSKSAAYRALY